MATDMAAQWTTIDPDLWLYSTARGKELGSVMRGMDGAFYCYGAGLPYDTVVGTFRSLAAAKRAMEGGLR